MNTDDEFVDISDNANPFPECKRRQKKGVIKNARNHMSGRIHLDPPDEESQEGVEFFQPIYEGELIVGVIHKCSCGKTSELRFQYTEQ